MRMSSGRVTLSVGMESVMLSKVAAVMKKSELTRPSAGPLLVDVITDHRRFLELEIEWNRLVEEAGIKFPFVRHEWIRAVWDGFHNGGTLHILTVHDGGRLTAVAPLMRDQVRIYGLPVRRLRGITNVYTERYDFILTVRSEDCCVAMWNYLADHAQDWDVLELRELPAQSPTLDMFPPSADRCFIGRWPTAESPYVAVREPWETYYKGLKKTHRHDMRKRIANLEQHGPIGLEVIQSDRDMDRDFQDVIRMESWAWKGAERKEIERRAGSRAVYRDT